MNRKPLTYDSLKTVILYMDANTRLLISSRIPSLHTTEQLVPLKIEELVIGQHKIGINQIDYEYGIYLCKEGKEPWKVSGSSGLAFKWTCKVDEYGMRDYITRAGGMLPGNNGRREENLFGEHDLTRIPTNTGRLRKLRQRIELEKQRRIQLVNYRPKSDAENITSSNYGNLLKFNTSRQKFKGKYTKKNLELLENKLIVELAISQVDHRIKEMENEIVLFENTKNNIRPKFEIHLTKGQKYYKVTVLERVNYDRDIHKAGNSLMKFIFSKRPLIQVNKLVFPRGCLTKIPGFLLYKLKIKNLDVTENVPDKLELAKLVTNKSSVPMEKLTMHILSNENPEMDYAFMNQFKVLEVEGIALLKLRFMESLQNQKVLFQMNLCVFLDFGDFISLIKNWVETNKPIGTCFTFFHWYTDEEKLIKIMNRVKHQIDGAIAGDKYVDIPMNNGTVTRVSNEQSEGEMWIQMEVVPFE
uniref:FBA_2 domain-containing protein n=1 Tax=Caenorhabditis tropicalis TaxID=1561998 RepID=A0A1I7TAJ4_9PELO